MMRQIQFLLLMLLPLLFLSLASPAIADRGMIPVSDVSVYGPGQKAIIAWNGEEEILILSTDVYASGDSIVLEILPLPAEPQSIQAGDFASFIRMEELMTEHFPYPMGDRFQDGLPGLGKDIEIVFHQKIGPHDITVVKASDAAELVYWAEGFLGDRGLEYNISSPKLESVVGGYIGEGFEFFVFDLIELTSAPHSIEPIFYRFETDFLYYPLVISSLASGETDISLFLLTPGVINLAELPRGMHVGLYYGEPVRFEIGGEELGSIAPEIAGLLGDRAWLTAVKYEGDLDDLESDLKLYSGRSSPELAFASPGSSCAATGEGPAAIISLRGNRVFFSGFATAPTPCHQLDAELVIPASSLYPQTIIVDITAHETPGTICIQCIGEILFKGEIRNLDPGEYEIQVCYQGNVLAQQMIQVPGETEPLELAPGTTLEVNPGDRLIIVDGVSVELSAPAIEIMIQAYTGVKELRIEVDEILEQIKITANGVSAIAEETIIIEDSQLFLESLQGSAPVRVMPDEVLEILLEQEIQSFELNAMDGRTVFAIEGIAKARLFGLFTIDMTLKTTVDARSGEMLQEETPWWAVFCGLPQRGMGQ